MPPMRSEIVTFRYGKAELLLWAASSGAGSVRIVPPAYGNPMRSLRGRWHCAAGSGRTRSDNNERDEGCQDHRVGVSATTTIMGRSAAPVIHFGGGREEDCLP